MGLRDKAEAELIQDFYRDQGPLVRGRVNIMLLIGVTLVPFFGWVDALLYPTLFRQFMVYRLLTAVSCLCLYWVNYRRNLGYWSFRLAIAGYYITGIAITKMIIDSNGFASPYYAGMNLVFLTSCTVLTIHIRFLLVHCIVLYAIFVASLLLFGHHGKIDLFLANNMFIIATLVIILVASYVNHRLRWTEYLLRRELEEAQEELVRRERFAMLGTLIAVVSHELRNPLGTIRASLFAIADRVRDEGLGLERPLERAERNIIRCDKIIEELLDYTRSHDFNLEETVLDEWLEEALDEQTMPEGIDMTRDLDSKAVLMLNRDRLRRSVINIIVNACQAIAEKKMDEQSGKARTDEVRVESRSVGDRVEIRVSDTGMGIAPEEIEKIFQPLYSTKGFGVGLGLPIVKQIMEQHGGGIEISSKPGEGATVTMWLPSARKQVAL